MSADIAGASRWTIGARSVGAGSSRRLLSRAVTGKHAFRSINRLAELARANVGDVSGDRTIDRHQERILNVGIQLIDARRNVLRALCKERQRDFELLGPVQILKPLFCI